MAYHSPEINLTVITGSVLMPKQGTSDTFGLGWLVCCGWTPTPATE